MRESTIRQYLPAIAEIFARHAAAAMILWFDHETPRFHGIDGEELERRKAQANSAWVRDILTGCRRLMLEALESEELRQIVSAIENSGFEPDGAEVRR